MTKDELRDRLAMFLASGTASAGEPNADDYIRADMVIALFAQHDPFREVLEFITLASSAPGGAKITTHWMHQALVRGGLSDTDRAFRKKLTAHPPAPDEPQSGDVVTTDQAREMALNVCRGCVNIADDCFPEGDGSCRHRKVKEEDS